MALWKVFVAHSLSIIILCFQYCVVMKLSLVFLDKPYYYRTWVLWTYLSWVSSLARVVHSGFKSTPTSPLVSLLLRPLVPVDTITTNYTVPPATYKHMYTVRQKVTGHWNWAAMPVEGRCENFRTDETILMSNNYYTSIICTQLLIIINSLLSQQK